MKKIKNYYWTKRIIYIITISILLAIVSNDFMFLSRSCAHAETQTNLEKHLKYIYTSLIYISQQCRTLSIFESKFEKPNLDIHPLQLDSDGKLRKELVKFSLDNKYKVLIMSIRYVPNSYSPLTNTVQFDFYEKIEYTIRNNMPVDDTHNKYEDLFWRYTFKLPEKHPEVPKAIDRTKRISQSDIYEKQVICKATVNYEHAKFQSMAGFEQSSGTREIKNGDEVLITFEDYVDALKKTFYLIYDVETDEILGWLPKWQLNNIQPVSQKLKS